MKREHKLKILAFFLSATLWYFVVWGKPVEKNLEVPISIKENLQSNYVWEINPSTISVKIVATRSQIRNLEKNKIQIDLDLLHYPPGIHQIRVPIEKIQLPEGIKIKEVSPNYISLVIRKVSTKKVPVKLKLAGKPPQKSMKITISPPIITIKGFWEDIKDIQEVYTEEINWETLKNEKIVYLHIVPPSRVLEVAPDRVKIVQISK
ncbi:MAG: YbbR-like domain-containing protein [Caldimicrobium sp.]